MRVGRFRSAAAVLVLLGACTFATDIDRLEVVATGAIGGQAFVDLDGNEAPGPQDRPFAGAGVVVTARGTGAVVAEADTDTLGAFLFTDLPVGEYDISFAADVLGDSLTLILSAGSVTLEPADTIGVLLGVTYPTLSLAAVRVSLPGRRVFTAGIALNARQPFGDGVVHFQEGATYLRATDVDPVGFLQVGDSVRLLGMTASDNGQPVLDGVTVTELRDQAAFPMPQSVTIAQARSAAGGTLDAALVRIGAAEITDTATVDGNFHYRLYLGTDTVEVVHLAFLGIGVSPPIRPDTVVRVTQLTGLLRPVMEDGAIRWRVVPRGSGDVATELKSADVAVSTAFDPSTATPGDTVELRVVVRNQAGSTHVATQVAVADTLPADLTLISSSWTSGSYSAASSLWQVGDLAPGDADTLLLRVRVEGGPGQRTNVARFLGLVRETETNPLNDAASAQLTVP